MEDDQPKPESMLEMAGTIIAFAKSLSTDGRMVADALFIAYQAFQSERTASPSRPWASH